MSQVLLVQGEAWGEAKANKQAL
jgi:hypothetical protein